MSRRRSAARGCIARSSSAAWPRRSRGSLLPTEQPFLYTVSVTATDGTGLAERGVGAARRARSRAPRRNHRCGADPGESAAKGEAGLRERQRHEHRPSARLLRDHRERRSVRRAAVAHRGGDRRRGCAPPREQCWATRTGLSGGSSRCRFESSRLKAQVSS